MRKLIAYLALISLATCLVAQDVVIIRRKAAAPGGPNTWYYACTATPTVEPTWEAAPAHASESPTSAHCSPFTVAQSGTLTKLSIKAAETYAEHEKLALYDTSGNQLSGACTTGTFVNETWMDCTLGTPYSITAGDYYICGMADVNSFAKYVTTVTQQITASDKLYADFPYATLSLDPSANECAAKRGFVQ